nr:FAD-dependent oxidoreductase [Chloroflexia bacterium]
MTLGEHDAPASLPEPIRTIVAAHDQGTVEAEAELPLHPDTVKRCLEDALLGANIGLLYASLPTGLCQAEGDRAGLIIGNKSGRQVVRCQTVIDATETALVARLAGGTFESPAAGTTRFARTLEFDRVGSRGRAVLSIPEWLQIAENRVRLHRGYRGPAHVLVEIELDLAYTPDREGAGYVEWKARRRSMRLATWLVSAYPEFAGARFAGSAHELHGRWTLSLAGPIPAWFESSASAAVRARDSGGTATDPSLGHFAGPIPGLWCLNEASRLESGLAGTFLDPVRASRLGEDLAAAMLETWATSELHSPIMTVPGWVDSGGADATIDVREPASPQRGRNYRRLHVPATAIPVHRIADELVAGGGSSGATAAITAGREGLQ